MIDLDLPALVIGLLWSRWELNPGPDDLFP